MKNPNWIYDELILALDLYISSGRKAPSGNDHAITELSFLLNKFWKSETNRSETLRNANGVRMKVMNFMRLDPFYTQRGRVGLTRGNKLEEVVWREYAEDPLKLSQVAHAIRTSITNNYLVDEGTKSHSFDDDFEAMEGKILTRLHIQRERSPKLIRAKKEKQLENHGRLLCEVCGFDFNDVYGERGEGFIECHHISPLCELAGTSKTTLDMLRLVCSNCHRMIHIKRPWLTIEELRSIIRNISQKNEKSLCHKP